MLVLFIIFGGLFTSLLLHIGRSSLVSLTTSAAYLVAFICLNFLCCNLLTANDLELVNCDHAHAVIWPLIFLYTFWDHRCCEYRPPIVKLRILNLLKPKNDSLLARKRQLAVILILD